MNYVQNARRGRSKYLGWLGKASREMTSDLNFKGKQKRNWRKTLQTYETTCPESQRGEDMACSKKRMVYKTSEREWMYKHICSWKKLFTCWLGRRWETETWHLIRITWKVIFLLRLGYFNKNTWRSFSCPCVQATRQHRITV